MLHLGIYIQVPGSHAAGWRHPEAATQAQDFDLIRRIALTAERGKFDFVFFADSYGARPEGHPSMVARLEPLTLLGALAATTSLVGIGATASTTYCQPFHLARAFASLDHLSGGRAAWNVVTGSVPGDAANFGTRAHPAHDDRYAMAEEFVDVVKGLWDGWDDDALIMDKAAGRFVDPARLHPLHHRGTHFAVEGPLNISRSPQGRPVIIQAGSSGVGQALAARTADVVFTSQLLLDGARDFHAGFKARVAGFGRDPASVALMPGLVPFIGRTRQEAQDSLARLTEEIPPATAFAALKHRLGHDVSDYPLDGPVPALPPSDTLQYHATLLTDYARRQNMTLRDLYKMVASGMGQLMLCGTPTDIADRIEEWYRAGAADGFMVMPPWYPGPFELFVEHVVPDLQRRGIFRREYTGSTLRDHLGIPRPAPQR
ncbi:LLM class flavin-dependent oxidoreductase [Humitalea sp. 24SJ18S-53]|uniref:LLM class flavin-dependent oxidoreductase n=1 Tax=Humitalea sp. 24SJ18S-53 TaxID=3422307 RepID=UPI003D66D367